MLTPQEEWFAGLPKADWPMSQKDFRENVVKTWDPVWGDRKTEVVIIGVKMDHDEVRSL